MTARARRPWIGWSLHTRTPWLLTDNPAPAVGYTRGEWVGILRSFVAARRDQDMLLRHAARSAESERRLVAAAGRA